MEKSNLQTCYSVFDEMRTDEQLVYVDSSLLKSNYQFELEEVMSNKKLKAVSSDFNFSNVFKITFWLNGTADVNDALSIVNEKAKIDTDNVRIVFIGVNKDDCGLDEFKKNSCVEFDVIDEQDIPVSPNLYRDKIFTSNKCLDLTRKKSHALNDFLRLIKRILSFRKKASCHFILEDHLNPTEPFSDISSVLIDNSKQLKNRDVIRCILSGIKVSYLLNEDDMSAFEIDKKKILSYNLNMHETFEKRLLNN